MPLTFEFSVTMKLLKKEEADEEEVGLFAFRSYAEDLENRPFAPWARSSVSLHRDTVGSVSGQRGDVARAGSERPRIVSSLEPAEPDVLPTEVIKSECCFRGGACAKEGADRCTAEYRRTWALPTERTATDPRTVAGTID